VPLGWTLSPGLVALGPAVLHYLGRTKTPFDDLVGAPSGVGYTYPSLWGAEKLGAFAGLTGAALSRTSAAASAAAGAPVAMSAVNVIGDPCTNGVYFPGCAGLNSPNMTALAPLLAQPNVEGLVWYTFGAGYSGWSGTRWGGPAGAAPKPVVGGRVSLWGQATTGTMLGVVPLVARFKSLLAAGTISTDAADADGYSLVPVHAWSHNVSDVVKAARMLEALGDFEIVTPTQLLRGVAQDVKPPAHK
jgi:hypothetical protein